MPAGRRRPALVLLVMLLCGAGFWFNFENRFAAIEAIHSVADPQGLLLPRQREHVLALRAMLRTDWGLTVRVRVNAEPASQPLDSKTVLISLHAPGEPAAEPQARVILPPLVDKALASGHAGKPFSDRLEADLALCAAIQTPGQCVEQTLVRLLAALEADTDLSPTPPPVPDSGTGRNGFRAPLSHTPPPARAPLSVPVPEHTPKGDSHAQSS